MKLKSEAIGTILLGERVRVSDPCYEADSLWAGTLENVLPGRYLCVITSVPDDGAGIPGVYRRVKGISICHEGYPAQADELTPVEVGVDSGQAGFFDMDYYKTINGSRLDEDWYNRACDVTIKHIPNPQYMDEETYLKQDAANTLNLTARELEIWRNEQIIKYYDSHHFYPTLQIGYAGILDDRCVVSSSGYGDGGYDCYVGRNANGQIVSAKLVFIEDEED